jgi:hypothetical protein
MSRFPEENVEGKRPEVTCGEQARFDTARVIEVTTRKSAVALRSLWGVIGDGPVEINVPSTASVSILLGAVCD